MTSWPRVHNRLTDPSFRVLFNIATDTDPAAPGKIETAVTSGLNRLGLPEFALYLDPQTIQGPTYLRVGAANLLTAIVKGATNGARERPHPGWHEMRALNKSPVRIHFHPAPAADFPYLEAPVEVLHAATYWEPRPPEPDCCTPTQENR